MTFRVTARDNFTGGGATAYDDMTVTSVVTGAAFAITNLNSSTSLSGGASQTLTWNVAGTTAAPINASNVDILWSTDGGLTYSVIVSATPNDGSQSFTVPNTPTTTARIKVRGTGNIFFDINNANLTVVSGNFNTIDAGQITNITDIWQTITLSQTFNDPIVIVGPPALGDNSPGVVRIRNVTSNSFQVQFAEWNYLDGSHGPETASYFVVENGITTLDNGKIIVAGKASVNNNFSTVTYASAFGSTPVVLTTLATANGTDVVTPRVKNVTNSSFSLRVQEEEANDDIHTTETVNYIATLPAVGSSNGLIYEVGTAVDVTHKAFVTNFTQTFLGIPRVLTTMQTYNSSDTATVRLKGVNAKRLSPFIEEEQSADLERAHIGENVGFFAFRYTPPARANNDPNSDALAETRSANGDSSPRSLISSDGDSNQTSSVAVSLGALPTDESLSVAKTADQSTATDQPTQTVWNYYAIDSALDAASKTRTEPTAASPSAPWRISVGE